MKAKYTRINGEVFEIEDRDMPSGDGGWLVTRTWTEEEWRQAYAEFMQLEVERRKREYEARIRMAGVIAAQKRREEALREAAVEERRERIRKREEERKRIEALYRNREKLDAKVVKYRERATASTSINRSYELFDRYISWMPQVYEQQILESINEYLAETSYPIIEGGDVYVARTTIYEV